MAQRGEMAEVELVEHDDVGDVENPVDHVDRARGVVLDRARAGLGWIRRHRVLAVVTVAVTVAAVAVPAALSARAERARTAALAALPGVLLPLASAPDVVWSSPVSPNSWTLMSGDRAWVRDDVLVLWEQTGDATSSLRALDALTGDEVWTRSLSSVPDLGDPASRSTYDRTTCSAPEAVSGQAVVVCLVVDSWQLTPSADDAEPDLVEAASVRLRVFDVATGETVRDRPLGIDSSFVVVGTDVVLAETRSADGPASLVRLDPSTGTERWSVDVPHPADGAGVATPIVQLFGDEIGVGWLGTTALFTADGDATGQLDTDSVWELRGHRIAPVGGGITQLRDVDTGRVLDLGGARPQWLATDDGSVPGVLVLESEDRLTGRDLATGQRAWQVDWPAERTLNLVVVDGMLARQAEDGLTVIDLADGTRLWHRSTSAYGQSMVTDGRRLLVIESVVGTGPVVTAYDARDGRRVWEVPIPSAIQSLAVVDHRLFGVGSGGVVALGTS
ncbi:PQQ-binding-like beta-propeller repeat protein [Cellulomonas sp. Leaf334]|uniref:outer membrane protein assembly factor BamB family protein n=1 Tax=Cellulomonas sp. Leaf334 TaxID=1736339 RepID=UPI0006F5D128|nr:PQQ-binding-like beta-propeller repeat protein [Cellulomonas sp. Leaf334]KQR17519.1 hypothetical protein ASF78_09635 [Cellulomonas sp. Leaf334]